MHSRNAASMCERARANALHLFACVHAYACRFVCVRVCSSAHKTRHIERVFLFIFSSVHRFCLFHFVLPAAKYVFLKFQFGQGDGNGKGWGNKLATTAIATRWACRRAAGKIRWQCLVCSAASASLFGKAPV